MTAAITFTAAYTLTVAFIGGWACGVIQSGGALQRRRSDRPTAT